MNTNTIIASILLSLFAQGVICAEPKPPATAPAAQTFDQWMERDISTPDIRDLQLNGNDGTITFFVAKRRYEISSPAKSEDLKLIAGSALLSEIRRAFKISARVYVPLDTSKAVEIQGLTLHFK